MADDAAKDQNAPAPSVTEQQNLPLVVLVVGMAGTGKTTVMHRLNHHCVSTNTNAYFVNLDPAVLSVPFQCSIDIRNTLDYKQIMKEYRLGPNGAIMTCLNLFATKFHQVISILEQRVRDYALQQRETEKEEDEGEEQPQGESNENNQSSEMEKKKKKDKNGKNCRMEYVFVDTPGQIEVFTWSASGQLITEAFASTFPTVTLFVGDAVRCCNPQSFMSTMLYSSSIMFKSQLPLVIALNKCDCCVDDTEQADAGATATATTARSSGVERTILSYMHDGDSLVAALKDQSGFQASLTQSLSTFVQEYYEEIPTVPMSAVTGSGVTKLFEALGAAKETYITDFWPRLCKKNAEKVKQATEDKEQQMGQLGRDLEK